MLLELYPHWKKSIESNKAKKITIESLYEEWCEWKVLHRAASSYIKRIDNDWKSYYQNDPIIKIPIKKLDKLTLDRFAHQLIEKTGRRRRAYYNASIIIMSILDLAVDKEIIEQNLYRKVRIDAKMVFDPEKRNRAKHKFTLHRN